MTDGRRALFAGCLFLSVFFNVVFLFFICVVFWDYSSRAMVGQSSSPLLVFVLSISKYDNCWLLLCIVHYIASFLRLDLLGPKIVNQGCVCCYVYMVSCVPGPADDHAGHRNPAANVVFLPSDRPGPPVTTHTASPHPESSESAHTLQLCPVDVNMRKQVNRSETESCNKPTLFVFLSSTD